MDVLHAASQDRLADSIPDVPVDFKDRPHDPTREGLIEEIVLLKADEADARLEAERLVTAASRVSREAEAATWQAQAQSKARSRREARAVRLATEAAAREADAEADRAEVAMRQAIRSGARLDPTGAGGLVRALRGGDRDAILAAARAVAEAARLQ